MVRLFITISYTIRFFTSFVVFFQITTVHSKKGDYCVKNLGVLKTEAFWLDSLIILQGIKSVMFTIWEFQSIDAQNPQETLGYQDQYSFTDYSSDHPPSQLSRKSAHSHKELLYAEDVERQYINRFMNKLDIENYISGGALSESEGEYSHNGRPQSHYSKQESMERLLTPYEAAKRVKKARSEKAKRKRSSEKDHRADRDT